MSQIDISDEYNMVIGPIGNPLLVYIDDSVEVGAITYVSAWGLASVSAIATVYVSYLGVIYISIGTSVL